MLRQPRLPTAMGERGSAESMRPPSLAASFVCNRPERPSLRFLSPRDPRLRAGAVSGCPIAVRLGPDEFRAAQSHARSADRRR
jgi:hypothetical protein